MQKRPFQYQRAVKAAWVARRCPPREKRDAGRACLAALKALLDGKLREAEAKHGDDG